MNTEDIVGKSNTVSKYSDKIKTKQKELVNTEESEEDIEIGCFEKFFRFICEYDSKNFE